jgi:hypothetical protein
MGQVLPMGRSVQWTPARESDLLLLVVFEQSVIYERVHFMKHPIVESMRVAAALGDPLVFMCPRRGRSFDTQRDALTKRLEAHSGALLMLLDGVRGAPLVQRLQDLDCKPQPLFPDDVDADLLAVSPLAVPVSAETVGQVFEAFWGQGLASLCLIQTDVDKAHKFLASQLYVETDEGEICILRLHDPRALSRLADIFHDDQLDDLMGTSVEAFVFEGPTGNLHELGRPEAEGDAA